MIERLGSLKPCKWCASTWHTPFACPTRRKPMKQGSGLKTTKRMAPIGKQGKKTSAAVAKWKLTQPPGSDGMWACYICQVRIPYLMCEHVYSKARHPELRQDPNNFEPVCAVHNKLKGSLDIDDFLAKYPVYKSTVNPKYLKD